jgi:NAD(P)-dependent dehydrogenase (short-subunit alcohol dehydrogenase family)
VCVNYLQDERGAVALVQEIRRVGGVAHACQADVGKNDDVVRLFADLDSALGAVSAVVCNARAPCARVPVEHLESVHLQRQLDTAVLGSLLCAREAVRRMSRLNGAGGGALVFVSPRAPRAGDSEGAAEEAAIQAARDALTTTLAKELQSAGIRVNSVRAAAARIANWSGGIANRTDHAVSPMAMELGTYADEAAKQILWLISDEADRTTGARIEVACRDQAQ